MLSFLVTIGSFVPGLFGKTISSKAAKIIGGSLLFLLLLAILYIGKCSYDASVVNRANVEHEAVVADKTLKADRAADEALENKAAAFDDSQAKLEEVTRDAAKADPVAAGTKVGPVTASYYEALRKKEKK